MKCRKLSHHKACSCSKSAYAYTVKDKICKICKFRVYSTRYGYCNECYKSIRDNWAFSIFNS